MNGDVSIGSINEFLNEFLEDAGKMEEINNIDKKITHYQNKLTNLENKDINNEKNIIDAENELKMLKENFKDNTDNLALKSIETAKNELNNLENHHIVLKTQISKQNENINDLNQEKDNLIKKCLMKLHADMKKNHRRVTEDHDKYVELYTKAREERHSIERKMMNLKVLVYKNYKIRLI